MIFSGNGREFGIFQKGFDIKAAIFRPSTEDTQKASIAVHLNLHNTCFVA